SPFFNNFVVGGLHSNRDNVLRHDTSFRYWQIERRGRNADTSCWRGRMAAGSACGGSGTAKDGRQISYTRGSRDQPGWFFTDRAREGFNTPKKPARPPKRQPHLTKPYFLGRNAVYGKIVFLLVNVIAFVIG
ncbi:MAG TPA: hypothetical protein VFN27_05005, partial [Xanthobacteraceae bacterium]|nr:hypothetical protein [Xanthobacteraceae bacterium]